MNLATELSAYDDAAVAAVNALDDKLAAIFKAAYIASDEQTMRLVDIRTSQLRKAVKALFPNESEMWV